MSKFVRAATEDTPEVDFDFHSNYLKIAGQSYPEDPREFWVPVLDALRSHLATASQTKITLDFNLSFLNSTSFRAVLQVLKAVDGAVANGNTVNVLWRFRKDDEFARDNGKELEKALRSPTLKVRYVGEEAP